MTYEQKLEAMQSLGDANVRMRKPGDWYVEHNVEVKAGFCLEGRYGNGASPALAIEDHWNALTNLATGEYLVINAYAKDKRRAVRWNGFMWADVPERRITDA